MPAKIEQVCQSRDGECFDQCLGKHVSLMEGEWSCYRGGHFNKGRMVMLQRWQFKGGRTVMLLRWSV